MIERFGFNFSDVSNFHCSIILEFRVKTINQNTFYGPIITPSELHMFKMKFSGTAYLYFMHPSIACKYSR